eukprot:15460118-Alexandrium_andersonii.AAC.1
MACPSWTVPRTSASPTGLREPPASNMALWALGARAQRWVLLSLIKRPVPSEKCAQRCRTSANAS